MSNIALIYNYQTLILIKYNHSAKLSHLSHKGKKVALYCFCLYSGLEMPPQAGCGYPKGSQLIGPLDEAFGYESRRRLGVNFISLLRARPRLKLSAHFLNKLQMQQAN